MRGALAVAPGGYQYQGIAEYVATHSQIDTHAAALLPIVLLKAEAADPSLDVTSVVGAEMSRIVDHARTHCLSQMRSDVKEVPKAVFKSGADLSRLIDYMKKQSIDDLLPTVPLMIIQGHNDKPVRGADHHASLTQSEFMVDGFIDAVEQGRFTSTLRTSMIRRVTVGSVSTSMQGRVLAEF